MQNYTVDHDIFTAKKNHSVITWSTENETIKNVSMCNNRMLIVSVKALATKSNNKK